MYRILLFAAIVISVCVLIPVAMRGNQSSPLPTPPEHYGCFQWIWCVNRAPLGGGRTHGLRHHARDYRT